MGISNVSCIVDLHKTSVLRWIQNLNDRQRYWFLEDKHFNVYHNILAHCKVGEDTVAVGETFNVKTPKNQADIILVVEQVEDNEKVFKDLIPTLITDLKEELKQHGITYVYKHYSYNYKNIEVFPISTRSESVVKIRRRQKYVEDTFERLEYALGYRFILWREYHIVIFLICRSYWLYLDRDVHIGLIGFAEHMKWPQHYTTNGNTNIDGDVKNMKFGKPKPIITLEVIYPFYRII